MAELVGAGPGGGGAADLVRIWLIRTDLPATRLARLSALLDADEQARLAGLGQEQDRRHFTVAHACARVIAAAQLGVATSEIRWRRSADGKPELADATAVLQLNLSHSGEVCLVALSAGRPIGVDVQELRPALDAAGLAGRFFTPAEAAHVTAGRGPAGRAARFARLWTRKEAVIKAYGGRLLEGLATPVGSYGTAVVHQPQRTTLAGSQAGCYRLRDVPAPVGFRAAVALAGEQPYRVRMHRWRFTGTPGSPAGR